MKRQSLKAIAQPRAPRCRVWLEPEFGAGADRVYHAKRSAMASARRTGEGWRACWSLIGAPVPTSARTWKAQEHMNWDGLALYDKHGNYLGSVLFIRTTCRFVACTNKSINLAAQFDSQLEAIDWLKKVVRGYERRSAEILRGPHRANSEED